MAERKFVELEGQKRHSQVSAGHQDHEIEKSRAKEKSCAVPLVLVLVLVNQHVFNNSSSRVAEKIISIISSGVSIVWLSQAKKDLERITRTPSV